MNVLYFWAFLDLKVKPLKAGSPHVSISISCSLAISIHRIEMSLPISVIVSQDLSLSIISKLFNAAVGPMRSVQKVELINVL